MDFCSYCGQEPDDCVCHLAPDFPPDMEDDIELDDLNWDLDTMSEDGVNWDLDYTEEDEDESSG